MTFSFIIVNYNTKDLLRDCVNNLLTIRNSVPDCEIIVIDNNSHDGSAKMIAAEFTDKVTLIENPTNKLSVGHNLGYQASKGDYIVHLGTDCYPTADALTRLLDFIKSDNKIGVVTAKLIDRNGNIDLDAHRGLMTPWAALTHFAGLDKVFPKSPVFNQYYLGYKDFTKPHEIDACISHFMLVSRAAYGQVKSWDTDYFLYGEDIDFCYRVKDAGFKIMYVPFVEVLHYKGVTVGRKSSSDIKVAAKTNKDHMKKVSAATTQAMLLFYKKHLQKKYPWILNQIVFLGIFLLGELRMLKFKLKGTIY